MIYHHYQHDIAISYHFFLFVFSIFFRMATILVILLLLLLCFVCRRKRGRKICGKKRITNSPLYEESCCLAATRNSQFSYSRSFPHVRVPFGQPARMRTPSNIKFNYNEWIGKWNNVLIIGFSGMVWKKFGILCITGIQKRRKKLSLVLAFGRGRKNIYRIKKKYLESFMKFNRIRCACIFWGNKLLLVSPDALTLNILIYDRSGY